MLDLNCFGTVTNLLFLPTTLSIQQLLILMNLTLSTISMFLIQIKSINKRKASSYASFYFSRLMSTSDITRNVKLKEEIKELKDRKSTRLNSSHSQISYAVFCLKK